MTTAGKLFVTFIILIGVGIGAFFYLTRPIATPDSATSISPSPTLSASSTPVAQDTFRIAQDSSKAQFEIREVLNGKPNTAIGVTSQISGDIVLNTKDITQSQIITIKIDARTLKTDDQRRDNVIARFILKSEDSANQFIEFKPTSIKTASGNLESKLTFDIVGDLTIAGVTKPVIFHGTASLASADTLTGVVSATIKRSDYSIQIPSVPFVASVEDQVVLKAAITATRVSQ